MPSQAARINELPAWLSITQAAEYCGVDRAEIYYKMLRHLEIRRIGVCGVMPCGRLNLIRRMIAHEHLDARRIGGTNTIRIDRDSLMQLGRFKTWTPS